MKTKSNEDFRIIKLDPLQQPTTAGPGAPRAGGGRRGIYLAFLDVTCARQVHGGHIDVVQQAISVMARPIRPAPHPPDMGHLGGGGGGPAGGCAARVDMSSTSLANAGRGAGRGAMHICRLMRMQVVKGCRWSP